MNFEDFRKQRNETFLAEHTLDDDKLERLIENKFNRARAYYESFQKREEQFLEQD